MSHCIEVIGAKTHNLKNISVKIPKNKLVVVTGVSGSGKSSLAFDTIYAEGQRRYLESLSTYARMIISSINEDTKVDEIRGLSPTISIDQKTVSSNPRSTVGTITEIYDFYRLLFTTIGTQKCPNHPEITLRKHTISEVISFVKHLDEGTKIHIMAPIPFFQMDSTMESIKRYVLDSGFVRFQINDTIYSVADTIEKEAIPKNAKISVVIDRLIVKDEESFLKRLRDSLEFAYKTGDDMLEIYQIDSKERASFSAKASCPICHTASETLSISNFSFNSPYGACESCHGLGTKVAFLEEKIINGNLTLEEGAILPWTNHIYYMEILRAAAKKHKINMNVPYNTLGKKAREIVLHGCPEIFEVPHTFEGATESKIYKTQYEGVVTNLTRRYHETEANDAFMKRISQYITEVECQVCQGHRLKQSSLHVFVGGKNIGEISGLSVLHSLEFFRELKLSASEKIITKGIMKNVTERLEFLSGVGLNYMTISRRAGTISGGESQRIRLATQIGTKLEGITYILDEPSIGLHPRDNGMLIENIKKLVAVGSSVIVVEHDEDIMEASDYILDIGPGAGKHGGEIMAQGTYAEIINNPTSDTGLYLSGKKQVLLEKRKRTPIGYISIEGANENNLQNIHVDIPLGVLTVVTGVSGSGKSSLVMDILAPHLINELSTGNTVTVGKVRKIEGAQQLDKVILIDQSPIGRTPHSNIATYTGMFTHVREVFAASLEAQKRGYGVGRFSFNTKGGRCETCEGSGVKKIEMHFLPDVYIECEACRGSRYNPETLEVRFKGKTIAEVLDMTVEEALEFFTAFPRIKRVLEVLSDVGLGYIELGQSAPTLSGGEAQRIKLAFDLSKRSTSKTIYILDEPSTGLHFSDVQKLLLILDRLVEKGNTVLVIEHNLDIIANSDYCIDIGPEGGDRGGELIFSGITRDILKEKRSYTGEALEKYWNKKKL